MKKDDCIFCKLANGEIPTNTVYEDDTVRVILDADPAAKGHSLVIPKEHFANVFEIDDDTLGKAMSVAKKVAERQKDALLCDGVNILQNNGEASGQTVFHYHIHVLPRFDGDNVGLSWNHVAYDEGEQSEYLGKLGF